MTNNEYIYNAVRRINLALHETAKELQAYTSEKICWSVTPLHDSCTVELQLRIGDRQNKCKQFNCKHISCQTVNETNNLVTKFYWEYIDAFPDLLQHKFVVSLYAHVARLCGARSDVVQQFSIRKEDEASTTYTVTLRNYRSGMIQQAFSGLLIQNDKALDIIHHSITRMIVMLEGWPDEK